MHFLLVVSFAFFFFCSSFFSVTRGFACRRQGDGSEGIEDGRVEDGCRRYE
jgi:hypothetical protein